MLYSCSLYNSSNLVVCLEFFHLKCWGKSWPVQFIVEVPHTHGRMYDTRGWAVNSTCNVIIIHSLTYFIAHFCVITPGSPHCEIYLAPEFEWQEFNRKSWDTRGLFLPSLNFAETSWHPVDSRATKDTVPKPTLLIWVSLSFAHSVIIQAVIMWPRSSN